MNDMSRWVVVYRNLIPRGEDRKAPTLQPKKPLLPAHDPSYALAIWLSGAQN